MLIETKDAIKIVENCIEGAKVDGADIKKFGEELGRSLATSFQKYAIEKLNSNQMEIIGALISIATTAWSSWILESKAICHYRKPQPTYRDFLENFYLPNIVEVLISGRNIAIDEKQLRQKKGDTGKDDDVPSNKKMMMSLVIY